MMTAEALAPLSRYGQFHPLPSPSTKEGPVSDDSRVDHVWCACPLVEEAHAQMTTIACMRAQKKGAVVGHLGRHTITP